MQFYIHVFCYPIVFMDIAQKFLYIFSSGFSWSGSFLLLDAASGDIVDVDAGWELESCFAAAIAVYDGVHFSFNCNA